MRLPDFISQVFLEFSEALISYSDFLVKQGKIYKKTVLILKNKRQEFQNNTLISSTLLLLHIQGVLSYSKGLNARNQIAGILNWKKWTLIAFKTFESEVFGRSFLPQYLLEVAIQYESKFIWTFALSNQTRYFLHVDDAKR